MAELLIFGAGYTGLAIAREAVRRGITTAITSRGTPAMPKGVACVNFEAAGPAIAEARFMISTAAPDGDRDPVLNWPGTRTLVDTLGDLLIPDLRASVILEGCGHWIPQERPVETNELLLEFLVGL